MLLMQNSGRQLRLATVAGKARLFNIGERQPLSGQFARS
jgi:hypothetical protein